MSQRSCQSAGHEVGDPIKEAVHGAIDLEEMRSRGIDPEQILDFSTNVQPFGPSPRVREAVCSAELARYPDRECLRLREAIAELEGVAIERILVGNGSSELLQLLALALLRPGRRALILGPTYTEYARASQLAGASVEVIRAAADANFAIPVERFAGTLQDRAPDVAFLCNPNNPTGQLVSRQQILDWVVRFPRVYFVVDESYFDFAEAATSVAAAEYGNLIVLKSMTKSYALAGLRLGYAIANREVIQSLCRRRVPWSVSAPAQAAGVAAIFDRDYHHASLTRLREAKRVLIERLEDQRWAPLPTAANFFLLPVGDATSFRERLLAEQILVRDCCSFGISDHIRIGVRSMEDNARLLAALPRLR
ncbi:threonine-phosphate decarboxylase CobD [Candidatus Laterigemmans baculatus]|uniref:threonine-phosphate decarboxylase CobD n=1 Tax=Candidatus Laterigemmans baculatus TaxID=2770505 RepID=UPI0013D9FDC6|nr:threonine-phosphate decarboxylase CobD [Candidatus Laterigemmans baculatus]